MSHVRTVAIVSVGTVLLSAGALWFTVVRGESAPAEAFLSSGETDAAPPVSATPTEIYTDQRYGFSFEYPADLELVEEDSFGELVIFGDAPNGETQLVVDVSAYDFDQPFTADFIPLNVLGLSSEVDHITLPSAASAFLFRRIDTPLGATRDVMFTHNAKVYHIAVTVPLEDAFDSILESWRPEPAITQ
jgi:hypothetical protein